MMNRRNLKERRSLMKRRSLKERRNMRISRISRISTDQNNRLARQDLPDPQHPQDNNIIPTYKLGVMVADLHLLRFRTCRPMTDVVVYVKRNFMTLGPLRLIFPPRATPTQKTESNVDRPNFGAAISWAISVFVCG